MAAPPRGDLTTTLRQLAAKTPFVLAGAGFVGGFLAFLGYRWLEYGVLGLATSTLVGNMIAVLCELVGIGLTVVFADAALTGGRRAVTRSAVIAIPLLLVMWPVVGWATHLLYSVIGATLLEQSGALWLNHFIRGGAWALVGASVGLLIGIASVSLRRAVATVTGGAIGGFVGGFLFDFIAFDSASEALAQFVGISLSGLIVGLSIALAEQLRRTAWLEVVSGGPVGQQTVIYRDGVSIGASPRCRIMVPNGYGVPDQAAVVTSDAGGGRVTAMGGASVGVNGAPMYAAQLLDGSLVTVGPLMLRYRERAKGTSASQSL